MKLEKLNQIKSVRVHWSENSLINDRLGVNEDDDIEKDVDPMVFNHMLIAAANEAPSLGSDKTVLTVKLIDGSVYCKECKFYLGQETLGLFDLIKM